MDTNGTVVVGVDGSLGSRTALEFAIDEAARRKARLRVVAAARLPEHTAIGYGLPAPASHAQIVDDVKATAQRTVDEVVATVPAAAAGVPIAVVTRVGAPGEVLVEESQSADLLVIGHRGRGRVASAIIGSVGLDCVLHAACPVTVVRPVPARAGAPAAGKAELAQA